MTSNLKHEADVYLWLRERLLEQHESLKDDEVALNDTLEGITHLHEAIEWTVQSIAEDQEMSIGIKSRMTILNERLGRIEHREETKRKLILESLQRIGQEKIMHPEFTVYRQKSPRKVVIVDETMLPNTLFRQQPALPDKKAIKAFIEEFGECAGAEMSEPTETLVIRRG
jgi:Gp157 protein